MGKSRRLSDGTGLRFGSAQFAGKLAGGRHVGAYRLRVHVVQGAGRAAGGRSDLCGSAGTLTGAQTRAGGFPI